MPHPLIRTPPRDARPRVAGHRRARLLERRFPESASPKDYGEGAAEAGKAAFDDAARTSLSARRSPATVGARRRRALALRLRARHHLSRRPTSTRLFAAIEARARSAGAGRAPRRGWACASRSCSGSTRQSFLIAHAVMHTTGQAFMMAFQAGGPHAQDRGLEAVAYAWDEMRRDPRQGAVGKAAGQERAAADGKAVSRRAARRRPRDRLLHVSDVERLSGAVRRVSRPATRSS